MGFLSARGPPNSTWRKRKIKQIQVPRHRRAGQQVILFIYLFIYFKTKNLQRPCDANVVLCKTKTKLWNWNNNNSIISSTSGTTCPSSSSPQPAGHLGHPTWCRVSYVVLIIPLARAMEALQLRPPDRAAGPVPRVGFNGHQSHLEKQGLHEAIYHMKVLGEQPEPNRLFNGLGSRHRSSASARSRFHQCHHRQLVETHEHLRDGPGHGKGLCKQSNHRAFHRPPVWLPPLTQQCHRSFLASWCPLRCTIWRFRFCWRNIMWNVLPLPCALW